MTSESASAQESSLISIALALIAVAATVERPLQKHDTDKIVSPVSAENRLCTDKPLLLSDDSRALDENVEPDPNLRLATELATEYEQILGSPLPISADNDIVLLVDPTRPNDRAHTEALIESRFQPGGRVSVAVACASQDALQDIRDRIRQFALQIETQTPGGTFVLTNSYETGQVIVDTYHPELAIAIARNFAKEVVVIGPDDYEIARTGSMVNGPHDPLQSFGNDYIVTAEFAHQIDPELLAPLCMERPSALPVVTRSPDDWLLRDTALVDDLESMLVVAEQTDALMGAQARLYDNVRERVVFLVEPHLRHEIPQVAMLARDAVRQLDIAFAVGCRSSKEIEQLSDEVLEFFRMNYLDVDGATPTTGAGFAEDWELGRASVTTGHPRLARELEELFGNGVSIESGRKTEPIDPDSGSRYAVVSPYYGGSRITNACTTSFAIDMDHGAGIRRSLLTAGHCVDQGATVRSTAPGSPLIGWARRHLNAAQNVDMAAIEPSVGVAHHRIFWTDQPPNSSSNLTRTVVHAHADPSELHAVCISGQRSGKRCGGTPSGFPTIEVRSVNASHCWSTGCFDGLIRVRTVWNPAPISIGRPGDSGAPYYGRPGPGQADARGMHIGRDGSASDTTAYGHRIDTIQDRLGGCIATAPKFTAC